MYPRYLFKEGARSQSFAFQTVKEIITFWFLLANNPTDSVLGIRADTVLEKILGPYIFYVNEKKWKC